MAKRAEAQNEDLLPWLQKVAATPWPSSGHSAPDANEDAAQSSEQLLGYLEQLTGRPLRSRAEIRRFVADHPGLNSPAWRKRVRWSILRQTVLLSGLAIAYLQFYFLDVNLQIQSLHTVSVFVPGTPPPRIST